MRIQEIVLDGFKSYAARTVINGFDEHFNAITGFNGSGKSNILDAICFVLGISTLSTVRVSNRQELIYKNGQAGVTKANVTILFENSDKSRCYEAYKKFDMISVRREYSVGGVSKCTINGTTVTNEKVLQLFSMSGLNVNNANFLIMQGRITQVINMKPQEILSLVEETAGTNAYEEIKKKTFKLIEKKDAKLGEIENIINDEVVPMMVQLEKENEEYVKWKNLCNEIEILEKKVKAATYYELRDMISNTEEIQKNYNESIKEMEKKQKHLENQIKQLEKQKNDAYEKESKLIPDTYRENYDSLKQKKDFLEAELNRKTNELASWEAKKNEMTREMERSKQIHARKTAELVRANEDIKKSRNEYIEIKKNLENFKNRLQDIENGVESNENFKEERINELERKKESLIQELNLKEGLINSLKKKLASRKNELKAAQEAEKFDFAGIDSEILALEHQISQITRYSETEILELEQEKAQYESEIQNITRSLDRMDPDKFDLRYALPEPGFDRNKIKGKVIRLIKLKEEKYAKALESGAGGRLFSVVVDTDVTGQLLLTKKTFGNVSILPNNRTVPNVIQDNIKKLAEKTFGNKVKLALDLVDYNQENHNSIGFIFGCFFVCETKEIAESIAYDNRFRKIAVTLEGDLYNPNGTLSGGESHSKPSVLAAYHQYQEQEKKMIKVQKKLSDTVRKLHEIERDRDRVLNLNNQLDIKKINKNNREKAMQESSSTKLLSEIEEIDHEIKVKENEVVEIRKISQTHEKEINSLKRQSVGSPKEVLIKTISKTENELKKSNELIKTTQGSINTIEGEIDSIDRELQEYDEKIQGLTVKIQGNNKSVYETNKKIAEDNLELKKIKSNYETKLNEFNRHREVNIEIQNSLEKYKKEYEDLKKDYQATKLKRETLQKESDQALKTMEDLESKHPYIPSMETEIQNFDKSSARDQLEALQYKSNQQSKKINKKVSSTLDDHQKRYSSLVTKRNIVHQDKEKLKLIIEDLDKKKQECINDTWQKVDKNLGEIYSMLLPGAIAKLDKVEDFKGLEMKVGFNGDWKKNLGELSGGQRSLLALSFILALLKYSPAPIYILDEIDAALDMSHTQNIGIMLKEHFSQSQFIVVSLKEGMFTNANVLFRTQFTDGRSVVERHALAINSADQAIRNNRSYR